MKRIISLFTGNCWYGSAANLTLRPLTHLTLKLLANLTLRLLAHLTLGLLALPTLRLLANLTLRPLTHLTLKLLANLTLRLLAHLTLGLLALPTLRLLAHLTLKLLAHPTVSHSGYAGPSHTQAKSTAGPSHTQTTRLSHTQATGLSQTQATAGPSHPSDFHLNLSLYWICFKHTDNINMVNLLGHGQCIIVLGGRWEKCPLWAFCPCQKAFCSMVCAKTPTWLFVFLHFHNKK